MIGYFRDPYPDELFYSLCARMNALVGPGFRAAMLKELFGRPYARLHVELPTRLRWFVNTLPHGSRYSEEELITHHTLFPFYQAFISYEQAEQLKQNMCDGNDRLAIGQAGLLIAMCYTTRFLRFCPLCVKTDQDAVGEPYWHRVHQLPGTLVCRTHHTFLENSSVPTRGRTDIGLWITARQAIPSVRPRVFEPRTEVARKLLQLAEDAEWILKAGLDPKWTQLKKRYQTVLSEENPIPGKVKIDIPHFQRQFERYYPPDLQRFLGVDVQRSGGWARFQRLWHGRNVRPPLHHLLMMQVLGYSAERFFSRSVATQPFGSGPWPCLNPVCREYQQPVIAKGEISRKTYNGVRVRGVFTCICGYSYCLYWPDHFVKRTRNRKGRVRVYGHVWEETFKRLWMDPTLRYHDIAQRVGLTTRAVGRVAGRLCLPVVGKRTPSRSPKIVRRISTHKRQASKERLDIQKDRRTVIETMQSNPSAGRKRLGQLISTVYGRLWEHDRSWMNVNLPPVIRKRRSTVNWQERDLVLSRQVEEVISRLTQSSPRIVGVTKKSISRELGRHDIELDPDRLPRTTQLIRTAIESRAEFLVGKAREIAHRQS